MTSRLITQKPIRYQFVISLENGKIGEMVVAIISPLMAIRISRKIENSVSTLSEFKDAQSESNEIT